MAIISQETWDNMPEKEKEKIRIFCCFVDDGSIAGYTAANAIKNLFGKENLQPNKIRTWEDVERNREDEDCYCCAIENALSKNYFDDKLRNKLIATYKIAKLIELGYGGMVTEEEWNDEESYKYVVLPSLCEEDGFSFNDVRQYQDKQFIAFHTQQQAEEFMSYPENVELVKQYNML